MVFIYKLNNNRYLGELKIRTENPCVAGSIPARATFIIEPTCNTKNILISLIPFISTPSVKNKI